MCVVFEEQIVLITYLCYSNCLFIIMSSQRISPETYIFPQKSGLLLYENHWKPWVSLKSGDFSALISPPGKRHEKTSPQLSRRWAKVSRVPNPLLSAMAQWDGRRHVITGGAPQGVGTCNWCFGKVNPPPIWFGASWQPGKANLLRRYYLQKVKLGEGSFGTVWRAVDRRAVPFGVFLFGLAWRSQGM